MPDIENLQIDLKDAIRKEVIRVCKKYDIDDSKIQYQLDLNVTYQIKDEIISEGIENDGSN